MVKGVYQNSTVGVARKGRPPMPWKGKREAVFQGEDRWRSV